MSAAMWQPVVAALGTLLVALIAYLTAVVRAHGQQLNAQRIALLTGGTPPAPPAANGAGSALPLPRMRPFPLWNQLADPLSTGQLPAQRYQECGEECVSEVIYAQHGVAVPADYLRYELGGPGRAGLTSAADLAALLAQNNVAAAVRATPAGELSAALQAMAGEKRAAIVLGAWISPGVLHWVLVDRADARGAGYNDPWGGVRRTATWAALSPLYAGQLVEILRAPDPAG